MISKQSVMGEPPNFEMNISDPISRGASFLIIFTMDFIVYLAFVLNI